MRSPKTHKFGFMHQTIHRLTTFALLLLAASASAETKISFRQITKTFPVAVQRGTKSEVKVHSNFPLTGAHSTFFAPAGVKMKYTEKKPAKVEWADPQELDIGAGYRFQVTVPKNQVSGVYEYRIATDQAVSSVGQLFVTDHPVVKETKKKNDTREQAQSVSVPAAICGVIEAFEDVDYYKLKGKKGQRWTMQIYAQRVTRKIHCMAIRYPKIHLMDSMLTLYGPEGDVVCENDNFVGGDSLLTCTLPEDGEYTLQVRDLRYAGDPRYVYCVEVSAQPQVFGVFPLAVQAGRGKLQTVDSLFVSTSFSLQAKNRSALWTRLSAPTGLSGSYPVLISPFRQTTQVGTNSIRTAKNLQVPFGVSGRFDKRGQRHLYRFPAKKGRYYKFQVQSQRQSFAVDSVLTIFDKNGKQLQRADDGWFTKDAHCYFQAPANGDYFVEVRDLNQRGGKRFIYHLQGEASGPDFELYGEYYYGMMSPGGQAIWFARIARLNGFKGPVEIRAENLPKGVTMTPVTVPAGMSECGLIFSADQKAKINASLVKITGRALVDRGSKKKVPIIRPARITCELRRAGASAFVRCPIKTQLLAVTKPLDVLEVVATPKELTLKRGNTATIQVQIKRNPKYTDQVLLDMAFTFYSRTYGRQLPPGVAIDSAKSELKLTGDKLVGKIVLRAGATALQVKRHPVAAMARVPITYSIMTNYASNPLHLSVE